jgi:hypothetical protein
VFTDDGRVRRALVVLGSAAVLITGVTVARNSPTAVSDSGPRAGSEPLPAVITGDDPVQADVPVGMAALPPADRAAIAAASRKQARLPTTKPGVPVAIDIPIATAAHPNGVHAKVTHDDLNPDGTLFVPADPTMVSWAREDAKPGSSRGTAILISHINFVIDGQLVSGALSDLAEYARDAVGKKFTVRLADGRVLTYRIVAGREYSKEQLAADHNLRASLYDQRKVYGPAGQQTGRLLLVSCGGAFDAYTGEYEDNVFLYALPVT